MFKEIGAILFILGMIFLIMVWFNKEHEGFVFELIFGPILMYAGYRLMS